MKELNEKQFEELRIEQMDRFMHMKMFTKESFIIYEINECNNYVFSERMFVTKVPGGYEMHSETMKSFFVPDLQ